MKHKAKIDRQKQLVKLMWPAIAPLKSIYDAQTVLNAVAGYAKLEIERREREFKLGDLGIDLANESASDLKEAMLNIIGLLEPENAREMIELLELFANTLYKYSAAEHLKHPMSEVSVEQIIS